MVSVRHTSSRRFQRVDRSLSRLAMSAPQDA